MRAKASTTTLKVMSMQETGWTMPCKDMESTCSPMGRNIRELCKRASRWAKVSTFTPTTTGTTGSGPTTRSTGLEFTRTTSRGRSTKETSKTVSSRDAVCSSSRMETGSKVALLAVKKTVVESGFTATGTN